MTKPAFPNLAGTLDFHVNLGAPVALNGHLAKRTRDKDLFLGSFGTFCPTLHPACVFQPQGPGVSYSDSCGALCTCHFLYLKYSSPVFLLFFSFLIHRLFF